MTVVDRLPSWPRDMRDLVAGVGVVEGNGRRHTGGALHSRRDCGRLNRVRLPPGQPAPLGAAETVDSARDQVGGVLETNRGEQDNELNIITRKLPGWAAIIAVSTAVTAFYGQNMPTRLLPTGRVRHQRGADHFRGGRTAHADAPPRLAVTDRPARNVDTAPIDGDIRP